MLFLKFFPILATVLLCIVIVTCESIISLSCKEILLGISIALKNILMSVIPFVIFSSIYKAFSRIVTESIVFIFVILLTIIISNFLAVTFAGIVGYSFLASNTSDMLLQKISNDGCLKPAFILPMIKSLSNGEAFLASVLCVIFGKLGIRKKWYISINAFIIQVTNYVEKACVFFLRNLFFQLLPLFVAGFVMKLVYEKTFYDLMQFSGEFMIISCISITCYLFAIFGGTLLIDPLRNWKENIAGAIVPVMTAFCTMSSLAALPFTIRNIENGTRNKELCVASANATVTTHMIGDAIFIPLLAITILLTNGFVMPSYSSYMLFTIWFVLTKFSGAGVPGGTIIVMIPILENYLCFDETLGMVITMLYIVLDPLITACSVFANNIFILYLDKVFSLVKRYRTPH
ncbi:cation:dicarboxylate symporter family transporter [Candidatus Fokinia crypta]|uniref:Sodium:dicarboxylate symporter family protein n=1 Tax=Candidatus Fokinia crypta TaxID=1920990 RepID=A0ABZ0UN19_9RICK|nr:cation:dicarboxylase symporter family transporter [Candidatus Fokinia cryptica]WPX97525.1 Sodium:dicarboxylate symporter family protein [Candidatus Fokinia cryptica]